jgi:hypothetical protein
VPVSGFGFLPGAEVGSSPDWGVYIVYSSPSRFSVRGLLLLQLGFPWSHYLFPFTIIALDLLAGVSVPASVSSSPAVLLLLVAGGPYPSSHRRGRCRAAPASSAPAGRPRQLAGFRLPFDVRTGTPVRRASASQAWEPGGRPCAEVLLRREEGQLACAFQNWDLCLGLRHVLSG